MATVVGTRNGNLAAQTRLPQDATMEADACVVHCMDLRFQGVTDALIAELGLVSGDFDRVAVAGGAGNGALLAEHLRLSERLHNTKKMVLTAHEDCGAGATRDSLVEALSATRQMDTRQDVRGFWLKLDGTWDEVEPV